MTKKESGLKKLFSQIKPAKNDCCSVSIEEVKKEDDCCGDSNQQSADVKKAQ